jgi:hypothetical protein
VRERVKNGKLDVAVCPSCATIITRQQMYEKTKGRRAFACDCGYEFNAHPCRPLTIAEILRGREAAGDYRDVSLEKYTRKVLEIAKKKGR